MKPPYFRYNLYDFNHLRDELDGMYSISTDLSSYTKTIYRGFPQFEQMKTHQSFSDAKNFVDKVLDWHNTTDSNGESLKNKFGQICLNGGELEWENYPNVYNWIIDKSFELFGDECGNKKKLFMGKPLLTLYTKGCLLGGHADGKPDNYKSFTTFKPANVLIYLNKDYKKEYGGLFLVENEEIIPNFGDIIFLNFSGESDPFHEVSEVLEDVNRFALLFNVQYNK